MICRTFKNGNITVKHEDWYDGDKPSSFDEFPSWLALHEDGYDVFEIGDVESWGNGCGVVYMKIFVNGVLGYYPVTPDDFELYLTGKTVRLRRESLAPLFTLPPFYKFLDTEYEGAKGCMYWMCDPLTDEQRDSMSWNGVKFLRSHCEYAPEIKSDVVFVPNGTVFSFC